MAYLAFRRSTNGPRLDAIHRSGYLQRRLDLALPDAVHRLRQRRRVATCLACVAGAIAFFGLYVLSWVLVLDL
jgi:hypothetical protein